MNRMDMVNQMYARGDEVSSGRRPGSTGPNVQRNMPGGMTGGANKVLTGSGRPPVGTMATPKPSSFTLPAQTLSRMGMLSRGGLGGLIAAGGLGLFEIGRQTGFEPENLGQTAAQVQKSLEEVTNEAVEVARELGQPIQDFVGRVVQGYQSQMGGGRQQQLGFDQSSNSIDNEEMSRLRNELEYIQKQLNKNGANMNPQANINATAQMDAIQKRMADIQMEKQNFAKGGEAFPDLTGDGQVTQADILKGRGVFAEGDEVSRETIEMEAQNAGIPANEVEQALAEINKVEPEMQQLQKMVESVMEMLEAGASEEEIITSLQAMGLDEDDIEAVFEAVIEGLEVEESMQQDPIQSELSQMM